MEIFMSKYLKELIFLTILMRSAAALKKITHIRYI